MSERADRSAEAAGAGGARGHAPVETRTRRRVLGVAGVACLGLALVASALGAKRLAAFIESSGREQWFFQPVMDRTFTFAGRPVVISDDVDARGRAVVVVRYGDVERRIHAAREPMPAQLPGMSRHERWLRVLRFAPRTGLTTAEFRDAVDAGRLMDRLVIVTRSLRPGSDPETFGEVWRSDWAFDFYELTPAGEVRHERLGYPESERAFERRASRARRAGGPPASRAPDELRPGTWEFLAASFLMPPHAMPDQPTGGAIGAMGWTLPAAVVGVLGALAALVLSASVRVAGRGEATEPVDDAGKAR
jgi:hypothetical protein